MTNLTAEEKLKHLIVIKSNELQKTDNLSIYEDKTSEEIEELYDSLCEEQLNYDAEEELREGQVETGIACDYSRHYESKSVGMQYIDGSWIGWTYWYGGGKHGEPEGIDWIDKAYDIDCTEEAEAEAMRIKSQALAGNPKLAEYEAVLAWRDTGGKVPTYMVVGNNGGPIPFMPIGK